MYQLKQDIFSCLFHFPVFLIHNDKHALFFFLFNVAFRQNVKKFKSRIKALFNASGSGNFPQTATLCHRIRKGELKEVCVRVFCFVFMFTITSFMRIISLLR